MALGMSKIKNTSVFTTIVIAADTLEWASVETEGTPIEVAAPTTEQIVDCTLQIAITFGASATLPVELHLRKSLDDGTTLDTEEVFTYSKSIDSVVSETIIVSHEVFGGFDYLDVGLKNTEAATHTISAVVDASYTKLTGITAVT